jgi:hypothetical protein
LLRTGCSFAQDRPFDLRSKSKPFDLRSKSKPFDFAALRSGCWDGSFDPWSKSEPFDPWSKSEPFDPWSKSEPFDLQSKSKLYGQRVNPSTSLRKNYSTPRYSREKKHLKGCF